MESPFDFIREKAPRWHEYYSIAYYGDEIYVSLCGKYEHFSSNADLVAYWPPEWTSMEELDWLGALNRRASTDNVVIAAYPLLSRHFDTKVEFEKLSIIVGGHTIHVADNKAVATLLNAIEAHLANLAKMRATMADLPTTVMRAVLYHFFIIEIA